MADLQSEIRAPLVKAPIAWVARRLLSSDPSVQVVMITSGEGKVLAHERALEYDEASSVTEDESSLIYYAPGPGLLFYVRLAKGIVGREVEARIEEIVGSPFPNVTR